MAIDRTATAHPHLYNFSPELSNIFFISDSAIPVICEIALIASLLKDAAPAVSRVAIQVYWHDLSSNSTY